MTSRVLVRCDGTRETGHGHLSRCLALAEALAEHGVSSLFCGTFDAPAQALLAEAGMRTQPASGVADVVRLLHERSCRGVVVDGYDFDAAYLEALAPGRTGSRLLVIDDFAALGEYPAEALVLNFTVGAGELEYRGRDLVCLLGPEYLLVRRALRRLHGRERRASSRPRHILVALGGQDRLGLSLGLAAALVRADPELKVRLAAGSYGALPAGVEVLPDRQLAPGFAWADVAVTGGGLTKYEAAYLGIPPLVVSQSDLEDAETKRFARAGLGARVGHGGQIPPEALAEVLRRYVLDVGLQDRLRQAAASVFPDDPTGRAAEVFVRMLG